MKSLNDLASLTMIVEIGRLKEKPRVWFRSSTSGFSALNCRSAQRQSTTCVCFCLLISSQFRCCGRSEAEGRTEMVVIHWRCRGNRLPVCWQTHSSARFRCEIKSRRGSSTVDPTLHHCRRSTSPGILLSTLVLYVVFGALGFRR